MPICERFWQGEPKVMMWTGGMSPPFSFVTSPKCAIPGKWRFVMEIGAFSISLAHAGTIPQRTAASGNTPIPSNRLPSRSAVILSAPLSLDGQYTLKGGGGDPQPLDAAESLRLFRTGERRALRLNEFFTVAGSYPQGSTEYNDVLDLAARLFPDSPEANINAAAVALTKGETAKARRYLERFATLPMAYNNMGILCLQEGNRDKAEVYLTMAAAAGVKQADKALKELKRQAEN